MLRVLNRVSQSGIYRISGGPDYIELASGIAAISMRKFASAPELEDGDTIGVFIYKDDANYWVGEGTWDEGNEYIYLTNEEELVGTLSDGDEVIVSAILTSAIFNTLIAHETDYAHNLIASALQPADIPSIDALTLLNGPAEANATADQTGAEIKGLLDTELTHTDWRKAVGTLAGTVAAGDDSRVVAGGTALQPVDLASGTITPVTGNLNLELISTVVQSGDLTPGTIYGEKPSTPTVGQQWVDEDTLIEYVWTGAEWVETSTAVSVLLDGTALPSADVRELLTAPRTYYVATTGSDSNDGLTSGSPFLTIQHAVNTLCSLDMSIYQGTIQLADGTYSEDVELGAYICALAPKITGNATTPANVVIAGTANAVRNASGLAWIIENLKITSSGYGIKVESSVLKFSGLTFGACSSAHIQAVFNAFIYATGDYTISGSSPYHFQCGSNAVVTAQAGSTITVTGTPAFSSAFAWAYVSGVILLYQIAFLGSATGVKYKLDTNGVIVTYGGAPLPGSTGGTTSTGGVYT